MNQSMNEKNGTQAESKNEQEQAKTPRARLTVEVPTELNAGQKGNCVSCYCSRTYCCS